MVPVLCSTESLQGALLGGENSTGRDVDEWSVGLLLPRDPWLPWSTRVEEAEVGTGLRGLWVLRGGGAALQEMTSAGQLNFVPEDRECIGKPGDKP